MGLVLGLANADRLGTMAAVDVWFFFIAFVVGGMVYFAPSSFAWRRRHRNFLAVWLLNLLLGWTLIGWAVAFVWAAVEQESLRAAGRADS